MFAILCRTDRVGRRPILVRVEQRDVGHPLHVRQGQAFALEPLIEKPRTPRVKAPWVALDQTREFVRDVWVSKQLAQHSKVDALVFQGDCEMLYALFGHAIVCVARE